MVRCIKSALLLLLRKRELFRNNKLLIQEKANFFMKKIWLTSRLTGHCVKRSPPVLRHETYFIHPTEVHCYLN